MQTPVEKATKEITQSAHESAERHGLDFDELNRAITFAHVSINETHRRKVEAAQQ